MEELKLKSNQDVLKQNIRANSRRIEELNKSIGLSDEQVNSYKDIQNKIEENLQKTQSIKDDFLMLKDLNIEIFQQIKTLKQRKDVTLKELKTLEIKSYYEGFYKRLDEVFDIYNIESIEMNRDYESLIYDVENKSKFRKIHNDLSKDYNALRHSVEPFIKDAQTKKFIEQLNQSIAGDRKSLEDINTLNIKISDKKILLNKAKSDIFDLYRSNYNQYSNIINKLKDRTVELQKDGLNIIGKIKFNYPKLRYDLMELSDGRSASYNKYELLNEQKKATDDVSFEHVFSQIGELFNDIVDKKYTLSKKASIENVIKLILTDYFFDFWEISYKNDKLGEMSTGKASFVILMLIVGLSKSKAPILIDQPEDNLDNRSITTDLVNYLRNKKLERQIIVVTHNANIVVNADAENVIVANQLGQNNDKSTSAFRFDYINGAIENSFDKKLNENDILKSMGIRQHIADIVEGGKDAFIMREKKYRFR